MKVPALVKDTTGFFAMRSVDPNDPIHFYAVQSAAHLRFKACELIVGTVLYTLANMVYRAVQLQFCEMCHVLKQGTKMWLCAFYMLYEPYEGREWLSAAQRAMHHHGDFPRFLNVKNGALYLARCMEPFVDFEEAQREVATQPLESDTLLSHAP